MRLMTFAARWPARKDLQEPVASAKRHRADDGDLPIDNYHVEKRTKCHRFKIALSCGTEIPGATQHDHVQSKMLAFAEQ